MTEAPACTPHALLHAVDGNLAVYRTMVQAYLDSVPPELASLHAAAAAGDAPAVRRHCHDLRSSVLLFGAAGLSALFALHETRARLMGETPDATALATLARLASQVESEIRASLTVLPPGGELITSD